MIRTADDYLDGLVHPNIRAIRLLVDRHKWKEEKNSKPKKMNLAIAAKIFKQCPRLCNFFYDGHWVDYETGKSILENAE